MSRWRRQRPTSRSCRSDSTWVIPAPTPAQAGGLTVLTASQADQVANWDGKHRHGLFTEYFLEAVYGRGLAVPPQP